MSGGYSSEGQEASTSAGRTRRGSADSSLESDAAAPLAAVANTLVGQVVALLETTVTEDGQLSHESKLVPGSTIGKHLRHVHDHFRLLLDSLSDSQSDSDRPLEASSSRLPPLELNYDIRSRNLVTETSHAAALESFTSLMHRFEAELLEEEEEGPHGRKPRADRRIRLHAVTPFHVEVESTWGRELWFTSLHAIHHFSLLRVIATAELDLTVSPSFGVAPSTLVSREDPKRGKL